MSVHLSVFGSYIERWRGDSFSGATFDDGSEPSLQYAGCAAAGRMRDVNHTRPSRSIIGLWRSEEHTSELQSQSNLVCRLLLEKKKKNKNRSITKGKQTGNTFRISLKSNI